MTGAPDVATLAANLARNCGWAVFPCGTDKRPLVTDWPHRASNAPDDISVLWHRCPGPLIGIVTGAASGIDVLDLDAKHDEARAWWSQHHHRIPATRRYRTRSGGMHAYFLHRHGVRNTQSTICQGIDTRGDGGYVIHWFATGLPCLDGSAPAPWPRWLADLILPPPMPAQRAVRASHHGAGNDDRATDGLIRTVRDATEGERNAKLFWAACCLRDHGVRRTTAETMLTAAARDAGLPDTETRRTIASAFARVA